MEWNEINKCQKACGKIRTRVHCLYKWKMVPLLWGGMTVLEKFKIKIAMWSSNAALWYIPKRTESSDLIDIWLSVFTAALFIIAYKWYQFLHWMKEWNVAYRYTGILMILKKEINSYISYNVNKPQRHSHKKIIFLIHSYEICKLENLRKRKAECRLSWAGPKREKGNAIWCI